MTQRSDSEQPRTAAQEQARAAVVRFIPDSWDRETVANFLWRLDDYAHAIEAEAGAASPSEPLRAALEWLLRNAERIFDQKPVRDWAETLAEARAALAAPSQEPDHDCLPAEQEGTQR
jgi:hypothetical protein